MSISLDTIEEMKDTSAQFTAGKCNQLSRQLAFYSFDLLVRYSDLIFPIFETLLPLTSRRYS